MRFGMLIGDYRMEAAPDSLSRRLGPVFAELAAQAANAQQGPKSGQQGVENPNPMPAPSKAYKPAPGGYPDEPRL